MANLTLRLCAVTLAAVFLSACGADMPTRDELAELHPDVTNDVVPENKQIICPFLRMIERAGLFTEDGNETGVLNRMTVVSGTTEFGCDSLFCSTLANSTGAAQGLAGKVDVEALASTPGISHECGLTFGFGSKQVDDMVREDTLDRLFALADEDGRLVFNDLMSVKLAICAEQGVEISALGDGEVKLIFAFLGGVDRGFVDFADVDAFLHARLPETITGQRLSTSLLGKVQ